MLNDSRRHFLAASLTGLAAFFLLTGDPAGGPNVPLIPVRPRTPTITTPVPGHLSYAATKEQLQKWHQEAPWLTVYGTYGKSSRGQDLVLLRVTAAGRGGRDGKPVLVTACIHGNEPLSSSVVMGYAGRLLSLYGKDARVTKILDTRDLIFVPVVSPDSYPHSRYVDGVDPNRDFPGPHDPAHRSVAPVAALQTLFQREKFTAAWSGHTSGRQFLMPPGDTRTPTPDEKSYQKLFAEMGNLARYDVLLASELYGHPIQGSEVDWYYRQGALSNVTEYGTIQRPATQREVVEELDRTWLAFLLWLEQAPKVRSPQKVIFRNSSGNSTSWAIRYMDSPLSSAVIPFQLR